MCDKVAATISPSWSTGQRELAIGSLVEVIPSSQCHIPINTELPYFEFLSPLENKILEYFYCQGLGCVEIARRVRKRKTAVKSMLLRSRIKIATVRPLVDRQNFYRKKLELLEKEIT
jgi:hypothetical protein